MWGKFMRIEILDLFNNSVILTNDTYHRIIAKNKTIICMPRILKRKKIK